MPKKDQLSAQYRTQIETAREMAETDPEVVHAVDLHKAKFSQEKAFTEYQMEGSIEDQLPGDVYETSERLVSSRGEVASEVDVEDAWTEIATEDEWVGTISVQTHREQEDLYLRGYPFLIAFSEGKPRVILNKILVGNERNLEQVYANEWARPWVIAKILDSTGFDANDLVLATMKAESSRYEDLSYLRDIAIESVSTLLRRREDVVLPNDRPAGWEPPSHEAVETQLLKYDSNRSLFTDVGHGDSIRHLIKVFQAKEDPKGTPPDRGKTLS